MIRETFGLTEEEMESLTAQQLEVLNEWNEAISSHEEDRDTQKLAEWWKSFVEDVQLLYHLFVYLFSTLPTPRTHCKL